MAEKKKKTTTRKKTTTKKTEAKKKLPVKAEAVKAAKKPVETAVPPVAQAAPPPPPVVEEKVVVRKPKKQKLPAGPKYYGTGRRKEATAKVWLKPGSGNFTVNGKGMTEYFSDRKILEYRMMRPLNVTNTKDSYDVFVEAFGGGIPGQAGAVTLGIARALLQVSPDFRVKLKREGLLRRDPRMKERKKYGLKRARRAFQYTKR
ncbi:MAG: 30S ribosomal protein S9 [Candidatus Margulisiibacteriota bacterium]